MDITHSLKLILNVFSRMAINQIVKLFIIEVKYKVLKELCDRSHSSFVRKTTSFRHRGQTKWNNVFIFPHVLKNMIRRDGLFFLGGGGVLSGQSSLFTN